MATNIPGDINQTRQRNAAPVAKKQTSFDVTNTPGLKPAAIPPAAAPGYSSFTPVRDLQAAADSRKQTTAVRANDALTTINAATASTIDKARPLAAPGVAGPAFDPNPNIRAAEVAGQQQQQAAAVAAIQQQPGNPARAAQMQAQFNQPVTRGDGTVLAPQVPVQPAAEGVQSSGSFGAGFDALGNLAGRAIDAQAGAGQAVLGLGATIPAAVMDYGRQGIAALSGGELTPQQQTQFRDAAGDLMGGGVDKLTGAFDGAGSAVRNMVGATERKPEAAGKPATETAKTAETEKPAATAEKASAKPSELPEDQYTKSTVDGVVGRKGPNGQEYSNMPGDVEGALDPSQSKFRVGMQAGDSVKALETTDRALANLRETARLSRNAEVGNGPGNIGQISSTELAQAARRAKISGSATDRAEYDRLSSMVKGQDESRMKQQENAKPSWQVDAERNKAQTEAAKAETDQQLNAASAQQQAARARNLAGLEALIVDPTLTPEQRAEARQNYDVLTTPVKDRYVTVKGGQTEAGADRASQVFDAASGSWVEQQGEAQQVGAPPGMTFAGYSTDGKKVFTDKNGKQLVED